MTLNVQLQGFLGSNLQKRVFLITQSGDVLTGTIESVNAEAFKICPAKYRDTIAQSGVTLTLDSIIGWGFEN